MKLKKGVLLFVLLLTLLGFSQNNETDKVLEEGKKLYRLEKAAWYGVDDFLERFKSKQDSLAGYLSYFNDQGNVITIFYGRDTSQILVRYEFENLPTKKPLHIDTRNRTTEPLEKILIEMRQNAKKRVKANISGFYKFYDETAMSYIPVFSKNERKVYVITASKKKGEITLGNDYLLHYNNSNKFVSEEKFHHSLIRLQAKSGNKKNKLIETTHTNVISDFIDATDICSLLLYKDFVEWNKHIVLSDKQVTVFMLDTETLYTMTRKDWDRAAATK
jgi:hypothetical protein